MPDEYIRRTAITRLTVTETQSGLLRRTVDAWKRGCQLAVDMAWRQYSNKRSVQSIAYDRIREDTALGSQHAILATHQAAEAIKACESREANGRTVSKPEFTAPTVRYDSRTMTLFDDGTVSLTTIDTRVRCDLLLPETKDGYQYQYLSDDTWELTESRLTIRDGDWYLHIGFRRPKPINAGSSTENGTVLGVDLGIEQLAVTSTGRFFSGAELRHEREQFLRTRCELQATRTRSARRTLRQRAQRESRFASDYLHRVSNGIVEEALDYGCSTIAFEELTGITERIAGAMKFHSWAFRCLVTYVEYKAEVYNIDIVFNAPENTSRRCSRTDCHHVSRANRPARDRFKCQTCGYEVHADYNAAKNIGLRTVRCGHTPSQRTGASQCALMSGTVTPNGGFTAYPDGFEAEFTDKSDLVSADSSGQSTGSDS